MNNSIAKVLTFAFIMIGAGAGTVLHAQTLLRDGLPLLMEPLVLTVWRL